MEEPEHRSDLIEIRGSRPGMIRLRVLLITGNLLNNNGKNQADGTQHAKICK